MMGAVEKTVSMLRNLSEPEAYKVYVFTLDLYKNKSKSANDGVDKAMAKLDEISKLDSNWNGYGAEPISKEIIDKVAELLPNLNKQPEIFPTADDTIQLEYDGENESYLEFNIDESDEAAVYLVDKKGNERDFAIRCDEDQINKIVGEFYE